MSTKKASIKKPYVLPAYRPGDMFLLCDTSDYFIMISNLYVASKRYKTFDVAYNHGFEIFDRYEDVDMQILWTDVFRELK